MKNLKENYNRIIDNFEESKNVDLIDLTIDLKIYNNVMNSKNVPSECICELKYFVKF